MKLPDLSENSLFSPIDLELVLQAIDTSVATQTGKHLTTLQTVIIRGVWIAQSYQDIAQSFHCSETHVKKVGADLWELLSTILSEPVSKKTVRAILERHNPELLAVMAHALEPASEPSNESPDRRETALEFPDGPVKLTSILYLERAPIETRCYEAIGQPGGLIRIKAPQQMGKTSLLNRILSHARQQGYQIVTLDLQLVDNMILQDLDRFLQWFCASVTQGLQLPVKLTDYWDEVFGSKMSCRDYFKSYLLPQLQSPLVLALDKVDVVFPYRSIADDFFALLRSWYEQSKDSELWQKLRLILVHSTEVYIPLNLNQSPFNVGLAIELPEFNALQVHILADRHGLSWTIDRVEQLMTLVGGHPYLVRLALYHIARDGMSLDQLSQNALTDASPFHSHLQQQFATLEQHPALIPTLEAILGQEPVNPQSLELHQLNRMGLIRWQEGQAQLRCELYRRWLSDRA
jgi:hypothetical protein